MSYDRSWITRRIIPGGYGFTDEYNEGVKYFLAFARSNSTKPHDPNLLIRCPCNTCRNQLHQLIPDVEFHLIATGFLESYTTWHYHGEASGSRNEQVNDQEDVYDEYEMLRDAFGPEALEVENNISEDPNEQATKFLDNVNNVGEPIYPGNIKYTQLKFISRLLHWKSRNQCSDKAFDELLLLLGDVFPEGHKLPSNYYAVKKIVKKLSLGYEKIHACENDCMLFYGDDKDLENCKYCNLSRYKAATHAGNNTIPRKVLRYFKITPRLQRLYMSTRTAEHMKYHKYRTVDEGVLSHPADGKEWKEFDKMYPDFAADFRNVRLGLATDGFPPYSNATSTVYSVWPVVLLVYNLPHTMCMKDPYMFMTLLVPGPNDPGKNLNVYLRPLIDELIDLWQVGVRTFDASTKTNFMMRAALLWTISDFPGLGMVSGWSTHGKMACHVCMGEVKAKQLPHSRKSSFYGLHKGFLEKRRKRKKGFVIRDMCASITFPQPGKPHSKERAHGFGDSHNWTHVTSFFDLPYWDSLRLRHCIDVMHTEKNVFDNIFHTILDSVKTKDTIRSRMDLQAMGIMRELWLNGTRKPKAKYNLTRDQLKLLCKWVHRLKLPDGCSSNLKRCCKISQLKFQGMKSHDCHVFMQKLLPSAFRELLPDDVNKLLYDLSNFFKDLCSTTLLASDLRKMERNIVGIVCTMETIFPPALFDPMEHLLVHLVEECILGGPVPSRWMYNIERLQRRMKQKVGNKARVEGSIAEKYIYEELTHFCSMYFESEVDTVHNMLGRNMVDDRSRDPEKLLAFTYPVELLGAYKGYHLDMDSLRVAAHYILTNMHEVAPYITMFEDEIRSQGAPLLSDIDMDKLLKDNFVTWLQNKVPNNYEQLQHLLQGPTSYVISYKRCKVNGYSFNLGRSSSGVLVKGSCYGDSESNYYGTLQEVLKVTYCGGNQVILFKCQWYDHIRGVKKDKNGVLLIDLNSKLKGNDVYILASQATQVYYAPSVKNPDSNIHTIITCRPQVLSGKTNIANMEPLQEDVSNAMPIDFSSRSLFIDFSQYEMEGEQGQENEDESYINVLDELGFKNEV
nr:PREDICTED: uncharacterized protein LOC108207183 [Daucus carota subsp. sativus]